MDNIYAILIRILIIIYIMNRQIEKLKKIPDFDNINIIRE